MKAASTYLPTMKLSLDGRNCLFGNGIMKLN